MRCPHPCPGVLHHSFRLVSEFGSQYIPFKPLNDSRTPTWGHEDLTPIRQDLFGVITNVSEPKASFRQLISNSTYRTCRALQCLGLNGQQPRPDDAGLADQFVTVSGQRRRRNLRGTSMHDFRPQIVWFCFPRWKNIPFQVRPQVKYRHTSCSWWNYKTVWQDFARAGDCDNFVPYVYTGLRCQPSRDPLRWVVTAIESMAQVGDSIRLTIY